MRTATVKQLCKYCNTAFTGKKCLELHKCVNGHHDKSIKLEVNELDQTLKIKHKIRESFVQLVRCDDLTIKEEVKEETGIELGQSLGENIGLGKIKTECAEHLFILGI